MRKIATLFDRDWDGSRGVVPRYSAAALAAIAAGHVLQPTEKLDGTNVRVTVRNASPVRLEKRRNPSKEQKNAGITEPWYVDASRDDPADRYLWDALDATPLDSVADGEHSAEAVGPSIQGNPLELPHRSLRFLETGGRLARVPWRSDAPHVADGPEVLFAAVRAYLETARSTLNPERHMEGLVWHDAGPVLKIKRKDFK